MLYHLDRGFYPFALRTILLHNYDGATTDILLYMYFINVYSANLPSPLRMMLIYYKRTIMRVHVFKNRSSREFHFSFPNDTTTVTKLPHIYSLVLTFPGFLEESYTESRIPLYPVLLYNIIHPFLKRWRFSLPVSVLANSS